MNWKVKILTNPEYPNPLIMNRADPWIYKHSDGKYYFTATSPEYDRIELRVSDTLAGLEDAIPKIIWSSHANGAMSRLTWAPEIHYSFGKWHVYFAASHTGELHKTHNTFQHRMYVIEADEPLRGQWREAGQIETDMDTFSLDATVFESKGKTYYVWAQKDPAIAGNSNIYIAEMTNASTLALPATLLTKPEYPWECSVIPVNEGPAVISHEGRIFLTYSANATGPEYCIGLLTANEKDNLCDASCWQKSTKPVFMTSEENHKYGPGHNGFTCSEDGSTLLLVYHVREYLSIEGNPLDNPDRNTCVQPIYFNDHGDLTLGIPNKKNR